VTTPALAVPALAEQLVGLGLRPGDVAMVHASMRALGPVEGGADGTIAALDTVVGPTGTWLMTLGARDDWAWVNERPEGERAALLADSPPFDPHHTPADPDVGVLAERFRQHEGTLVSDHPEGRFGARGARAAELVGDVPWDDYYGAGSPLERLVQVGGKVLRLGADPDTVTLLHHAEHLADVPGKRRVRRHRKVLGADGPEVRVVETLDDSDGIVDRPGEEDYFITVLHEYLDLGRATTGRVGGARSELLDAADLVAFATAWMTEHLRRR
jgi:aminoglycoside N3'-acetyltransferase